MVVERADESKYLQLHQRIGASVITDALRDSIRNLFSTDTRESLEEHGVRLEGFVILGDAIELAQPRGLREVLKTLCLSSAGAQEFVERLLLVDATQDNYLQRGIIERDCDEDGYVNGSDGGTESEGSGEEDSEDNNSDKDDSDRAVEPAQAMPNVLKRSRARFLTCTRCDEEFDITETGKYDCRWHEGELEADYESDCWADHDEDIHGRIADLGDEYPEGFVWSCCNRTGDLGGCKTGSHEAMTKRPRLG